MTFLGAISSCSLAVFFSCGKPREKFTTTSNQQGTTRIARSGGRSSASASAIGQIILLDLVFSIDSIVTAVGMTDHIPIMAIAVVVAVCLMLVAVGPLSRFIARNPTIVMLALSFLLMIGMTLIADGFGVHVPKGYIYAAMIFSAVVETLNVMARTRRNRLK